MPRKLFFSYHEAGLKVGRVTMTVDGTVVCRLANHESYAMEISDGQHNVRARVGFLPVFRGIVPAGNDDWSVIFEQHVSGRKVKPGKFVLRRMSIGVPAQEIRPAEPPAAKAPDKPVKATAVQRTPAVRTSEKPPEAPTAEKTPGKETGTWTVVSEILLPKDQPFFALYTQFEKAPLIDASGRAWLFRSRQAYWAALNPIPDGWRVLKQELLLKEIPAAEAESFFRTLRCQYGVLTACVGRESDRIETDRFAPGTELGITNPQARRHIVRFTQLVRTEVPVANGEKGKEYYAALDALRDAEVLLLFRQNGTDMNRFEKGIVSGREVFTVYTDFEAIPEKLWNQGVRSGTPVRMREIIERAMTEHLSVAVNLYSPGGGIFLDAVDMRRLM